MNNEATPRVLHIITGLSTGGAETALLNLLNAGLNTRFKNCVVSMTDMGTVGPRIADLGVPVATLGMRPGWPTAGAVARLVKSFRRFRPDIIQGWMYHGNLAASLGARLAPNRPAVVWNIRQSLYSVDTEKVMTRQVIRAGAALSSRPAAILYNSRLSRSHHEALGFSARRGLVIPNGFDPDRYRPDSEVRARVRRDLGLPDAAPVVGHVARFHPMKDHAVFVRAAVRLVRTHPEVRFMMIGQGVEESNAALGDLVPDAARPSFSLLGERADVAALMQAMDIFCLSSWSEAFPNVLGEAMASGIPCVTTDVGDAAHIVADTGRITPPRDAEALAESLRAMVIMPPRDREALGRRARTRIETEFALARIVEDYASLYDMVRPPG